MSDKKYALALADFYVLGFQEVVGISSKGMRKYRCVIGARTIANEKSGKKPEIRKDDAVQIAIVGKPNSGKSTLMNYLAKKVVSHVSERPGTTLDYIMTDMQLGKHLFRLYDTAGIRKLSKHLN